MRPLLALEWCHIILLSGIECTSTWHDILHAESTLLHVDMVKRGLILLLAEFATENAEQLTWLLMNHIHSIVRWSDEPPVKDLIHSIYKNPSPSALFLQALNTRCCDCKDPSFLTKLLECVQFIHPTQSGSLVSLLVEQIIVSRDCRFYLSIRSRAEKLAIERLQMIMSTSDEEEIKSYFLPEDLKHLLDLLQQVPNSSVIPPLQRLVIQIAKYYDDSKYRQLFPCTQQSLSSYSTGLRDASYSSPNSLVTLDLVACKHVTHASPSICTDQVNEAHEMTEKEQLRALMRRFISDLPYNHESSDIRMNSFLINLLITYAPVYRKYIRVSVNSTESLTSDTLTCLMVYSHTLSVAYLNEWSIVILTEAFSSPCVLKLLDDETNITHLHSIINNIYDYFMQNRFHQVTSTAVTITQSVDKLTVLLDLVDMLHEPSRGTLYRLCVPLARLKCINSLMLIPPAVISAGFNVGQINDKSSYPIVPSEYLRDVRCLAQFIQRICKLGCICKTQFEEIWMTFLGVISLLQLDSSDSDDAEVTLVTSLTIKSLTKLLVLCCSCSSGQVKSPSTSSSSSSTDSCNIVLSTSTEIDVQSSLRFLLDLFHQIISAKPSPPVLSAIQRSYTRIFPLFFEKSHFELSFRTVLDLYRQAALEEDEMQLQYLELSILKCASVLQPLYPDRVYRCVENGLRSPVPSTRCNTLRGITLLLETAENVDASIATLTTEYTSEHVSKGNIVLWKIAFIIAENNGKFADTLMSHVISVISQNNVAHSERTFVLQSCRRLIECKMLTQNQVDQLVRLAIDRLHSSSLIDETATFQLLVIAVDTFGLNIGGDDDASSGMEKVTILFDRLKYCTLDEANIICDMLPHLLVKLFPMQDVLNKVIGEFLSGQQVCLPLLAQLMFRIFGQFSRNNNTNIEIVNEWVCLSLDSFGQLKPITLAIWSLVCFLLAASTNATLKLVFPCVRDAFDRTQQHRLPIILTIVYAAFRQELTRPEDKVILDCTLRTILGNLKHQ